MPVQRPSSLIAPARMTALQGSLRLTYVLDLVEFICSNGKTGELSLKHHADGSEAKLYFKDGNLVHAVTGPILGIAVLDEVSNWIQGSFQFAEDVPAPLTTVNGPMPQPLLEVQKIDPETSEPLHPEAGPPLASFLESRTSSDVMEDFLKVPGVIAVGVVGRDGFLIESAGASSSLDEDSLAAALAHVINGIEEMGLELKVDQFQDLFIEYEQAVLLCRPISDAILAVVAPDASRLGTLRHKITPLIHELEKYF